MADTNSLSWIMAAMDRLWFHKTILLSEKPTPLLVHKTLKPQERNTDSLPYTSPIPQSLSPHPLDQQKPSTSSHHHLDQEEEPNNLQEQQDGNNETGKNDSTAKARPRRSIVSKANRPRPHSSAPSTKKRRENPMRKFGLNLPKSMSCKSPGDLELEELKGFMDLGFIFKKEHLMNPRTIRVVPGLQRLRSSVRERKDAGEQEEKERMEIARQFLSEAWLIKRPDSPLLKLRVPRVLGPHDADMKKHLKFWARTVASVVDLRKLKTFSGELEKCNSKIFFFRNLEIILHNF